jgi:hypothetical protein
MDCPFQRGGAPGRRVGAGSQGRRGPRPGVAIFLGRGGALPSPAATTATSRDAIVARTDLSETTRADHLAVLWFVAEAEHVPVQVMREYITESQLMASTLYREIFHKGKAQGKAQGEALGEAKTWAETIVQVLSRRMGAIDPAIRERIRSVADAETLKAWYDEVLSVIDAEGAQRLADQIGEAPLPAPRAS